MKQTDVRIQLDNFNNRLQKLCLSSELDSERLKSNPVGACIKHVGCRTPTSRLLRKSYLEDFTALENNQLFLTLRPNKGFEIVLLNKNDYFPNVMSILSDKTMFQKEESRKDKTVTVDERFLRILRRLKQADAISAHVFERSSLTRTRVLRLYGVSKLHTEEAPLGLMFDMCNSFCHAVAHWLVKNLEPAERRLTVFSQRSSSSSRNTLLFRSKGHSYIGQFIDGPHFIIEFNKLRD
ncbi:hypothetical protein PHET_07199 [Paragonimus heterotremus]|uniref:Uncharacterized protein n=1 Tax=Paragonimus heterotremus TaxID=100268 RepID=A0A8J4WG24_9TREM|nr:hypothetical protein PHET_07199 [Paragonimus heterotremus]